MPDPIWFTDVRDGEARSAPIRAAAYVRASTEDQQYSTENQFDAIRAYAAQRGMVIVRTYADEGKSGLTIKRRHALKQLIDDVVTRRADFTEILVYDVSRWGRFQDADESAYYEYMCRSAGVKVNFCAEQFGNDDNAYSVIVKSLKRAMAGEYSRELSVKVYAAHARFAASGYLQGGLPGYGLSRLVIDQHGRPRAELQHNERKSIATDRVVLIPGPPEEVKTVQWIFNSFVHDRKKLSEIAVALNRRHVPAANGKEWTSRFIKRLLLCERYAGNIVWNRTSSKLNGRLARNAPDKWVRAEGVIEPIVDRSLFLSARDVLHERSIGRSDEEKLEPLRRILRERGFLTSDIIRNTPGVPSVSSYYRWFGPLRIVYRLLGYERSRGYARLLCEEGRGPHRLSNRALLELLRPLLRKYGYVNRKIIDQAVGIPTAATYRSRFGSMKVLCRLLAQFPEHPANRPVEEAQSRVNSITYNLSDDDLLNRLRELLRIHGTLTRKIINANKGVPHTETYVRHFGSMARVYQLIGCGSRCGAS
jgi:DNA invertase Pin-like site-specific DNA recombinase